MLTSDSTTNYCCDNVVLSEKILRSEWPGQVIIEINQTKGKGNIIFE